MGSRLPAGFVRAAAALVFASSAAFAGGRNPGSLLLFPEYDNIGGRISLLSITNTNTDFLNGTVDVEVVWLDGTPGSQFLCGETNQTYRLTPNDTLTLLSSVENPNAQKGFAYAFAKDIQGRAIAFDWLIGDTLLVDPVFQLDYAVTPLTFTSPLSNGQITDLDDDGLRDLDGIEYEAGPDRIYVPRYFGQGPLATSELVLINLTGGSQFTAIVNFLAYNDNEEVFSRNFTFRCWTKVPLTTISQQFTQDFLANNTQDDVAEIVGYPAQETGWFELVGSRAFSSAAQVLNPTILAFLIETANTRSGAELAFTTGTRTTGALLPNGVLGDPD